MDYKLYQQYLGEIPNWMKKYLELDIMIRLKSISYLCGMEYASKAMYDFKMYISRFDHSLSVAMITWNLTQDKKATLAALFHDVASPTFSHVVYYMNGDYINQESTEEMTEKILRSSNILKRYLNEDDILLEDIVDFKNYSVVDLPRPYMCADRLEGVISTGMSWVGGLTFNDAKIILDSIYLAYNEERQQEIAFDSIEVAEYVKSVNDIINELTHTSEDNYMMNLLASILKLGIEEELFTYDDLFTKTEEEIVSIFNNYQGNNIDIINKWNEFKNTTKIDVTYTNEIKNRFINPICRDKRLKSN